MSSTLLRLGLWIILLVIALYVLHDTFADSPIGELVAPKLMREALALGGILIVAGFVAQFASKAIKPVTRSRCKVCRTPVPKGAIYCREHLRSVLYTEDDRLHRTRPGV
jgi:predicted nucleic acid-binding Zn ribbon protein